MKKIYDKIVEVKIEGVTNDWEDTSLRSHVVLLDEEEINGKSIEFVCTSFKGCCEQILNDNIANASIEKTFFRNKPEIRIYMPLREEYKMTEKDYKKVSVRTRFELREKLSMSYLMEHLTAEEFIIFLKEHNLPFCSIAK